MKLSFLFAVCVLFTTHATTTSQPQLAKVSPQSSAFTTVESTDSLDGELPKGKWVIEKTPESTCSFTDSLYSCLAWFNTFSTNTFSTSPVNDSSSIKLTAINPIHVEPSILNSKLDELKPVSIKHPEAINFSQKAAHKRVIKPFTFFTTQILTHIHTLQYHIRNLKTSSEPRILHSQATQALTLWHALLNALLDKYTDPLQTTELRLIPSLQFPRIFSRYIRKSDRFLAQLVKAQTRVFSIREDWTKLINRNLDILAEWQAIKI